MDTALVAAAECAEVGALVDEVYQSFLGNELNNNSGKTKATLKIVLLNLYSSSISDPKLFVRFSRDENFYRSANRYVCNDISYQSLVTKVIPGLLRLNLVDDQLGFFDRETGKSFWSRMRSTKKLIQLFDKFNLKPWMLEVNQEREIIRLKDTNKKFINYKDDPFTLEAREQLKHINHHLEAAVIDLNLNDEGMDALLKTLRNVDIDDDEKHLSMFTNKHLYRIFSNTSFKLHGRFYGPWWQNIPRGYRDNIFINGMATVELDYSSFHPKMIHDLAGIEMSDDPYLGIGDLDRTHGKSMFNMMINAVGKDDAASRKKAIGAYMKEFRDESMTKEAANAAIEAVLERHKPIQEKFFSGIGLKLMFYDSQIANNVMLRAIDEYQTVVLPIHDSFICVEEFKDHLRELMAEEYIEVMRPEVPPGIDMKPSDYYLTDLEREFQAEYGTSYGSDNPEDPNQKQRREALELQAHAAQMKYGITIDDVFTAESRDQKYAPQEAEDVL
jgi:hypothetical protein